MASKRYKNQILEVTNLLNNLDMLNKHVEGPNDSGYRVAHTFTKNDGGTIRVFFVMEREHSNDEVLPEESVRYGEA